MNATFTRRLFAITGLAAIGGALYGLLPFVKRSKGSEPDSSHLLDGYEERPVTSVVDVPVEHNHIGREVLSLDEEAVREWYRKEYEIEPVYDQDGKISKFISIHDDGFVYEPEYVRRFVEEATASGDIEHTPVPNGVEGAQTVDTVPMGIGAATEPVEKTLH